MKQLILTCVAALALSLPVAATATSTTAKTDAAHVAATQEEESSSDWRHTLGKVKGLVATTGIRVCME